MLEIKSFRRADERLIRTEGNGIQIRLFDNEERRATFIDLSEEETKELRDWLNENFKDKVD